MMERPTRALGVGYARSRQETETQSHKGGVGHEKNTRYLGLDVHAETITAAIPEGRQKGRSLGQFPNRPGRANQD
jgi:hypothetical protein